MKRKYLLLTLLLFSLTKIGMAQEFLPWNDPSVNNINRKELTSDLYPSDTKNQWHSDDLTPRDFTSIHISYRQMGLGCIDSWGSWPGSAHQLPYQDYSFKFIIKK